MLGEAPTQRELELVAAALEGETDVFRLAADDRLACAAVTEVAERAGVDGFVALDLYAEVINPGWTPFPNPPVDEGEET